eukprot:12045993-Alexandrium_andersonii.AAC.1
MEEAWRWASTKVKGGRLNASWARGPAGTALRTVLQIGWQPISHTVWVSQPRTGRGSARRIDLELEAPVLVA